MSAVTPALFPPEDWPAGLRPAIAAFGAWRRHLEVGLPALANPAACLAVSEALVEGQFPPGIDPLLWKAAHEAASAHGVPVELLARPARAAWAFAGPASFEDWEALRGCIDDWAGSYGVVLARMAGATGRWQEPAAASLAQGFFLVGTLLRLPQDVKAGRIFIARADLEKGGVPMSDLEAGRVHEPLRRVLWKQTVRARDAFAQGQPLMADLERPFRGRLKRAWIGALALIDAMERRQLDLWSRPLSLTPLERLQIQIQALIGRGASRAR